MGRMEAPGPALYEWLLRDATLTMLEPFKPLGGDAAGNIGGGSGGHSAGASQLAAATLSPTELGTEVALELRCNELYSAVRNFESTHCLNVAVMSHSYIARRSELASFMQRVGSALGLPEEVRPGEVM
jgi:hypothetical protein